NPRSVVPPTSTTLLKPGRIHGIQQRGIPTYGEKRDPERYHVRDEDRRDTETGQGGHPQGWRGSTVGGRALERSGAGGPGLGGPGSGGPGFEDPGHADPDRGHGLLRGRDRIARKSSP